MVAKIEPWMKNIIEVKANGYVYPCKVIGPGTGDNDYFVSVILPNNADFRMNVYKNQMMARAHYNPTFDVAKSETGRKEEFLYPIGTQVYIKEAIGKKSLGEITAYNPETGLYTIEIKLIDGGLLKLQVVEGMIEVAEVQRKPENISNEFAGTRQYATGAIPEAGKSLRADMWRAQNGYEVPGKTEVEEAYKQGDRVLVMVNEYHGKKNWMPNATVIGRDDKNIFQPAKGSKWLIRFDHSNIEWSYPENRLQLDKSFYEKSEKDTNHSKYSFKVFDRVKIDYSGIYKNMTGTIVELSLDRPDYFRVKLDLNGESRIFPSYMLKHLTAEEQRKIDPEYKYNRGDSVVINFGEFKDQVATIHSRLLPMEPEYSPRYLVTLTDPNKTVRFSFTESVLDPVKVKTEEKTEEKPKSQEEEVIDLMTGFVSSMFTTSEKPIDFKKFKDSVGKIREMFK